jgi:hypothetical protein
MSTTSETYSISRSSSSSITLWSNWRHPLGKAIASSRNVLTAMVVAFRASQLRPLLRRFFYPSVVTVRLGRVSGIDGLFREILRAQFARETGIAMSMDIGLTDLATVRAELLPRALAREENRLLFEQHVVAPLHVLLVQGDYRVRAWVSEHHNDTLRRFGRWIRARISRRNSEYDPVDTFRLDPDGFSWFVWKNIWALPELEEVLNFAVPAIEPAQVCNQIESEPVTTAVKVAARLDTDHSGWADPEKLLRGLHTEIRAANALAADHSLTGHILQRVQHAIKRLEDFEAAYEIGTAQDPLPDWVNAALEAVDSTESQRHDTESITKVVRRIACRLWSTGVYRFPRGQLPQISANRNAQSSQPVAPSIAQPIAPPIATPPPPQFADYEVATGF